MRCLVSHDGMAPFWEGGHAIIAQHIGQAHCPFDSDRNNSPPIHCWGGVLETFSQAALLIVRTANWRGGRERESNLFCNYY